MRPTGTGQPLSGRLDADVTLDLGLAGPAFDWLNPKPELSLSLWHDEWHLFPNDPAISFDQQPQSQPVQVGGSAHFFCTVTAPQTPACQWYFNGVPMVGQTARTLLLPSVSFGDAGNYSVRVTAGNQSSNSAPATLTVIQPMSPPQIVSQPQGQSAGVGGTVSFTVQAQGSGPLSYRWSKDGAYLSDGGRIAGSASSMLQIANVQTSDAGNYRVRVSNQAGSVDSSTAGLTVQLFLNGNFEAGNSGFGSDLSYDPTPPFSQSNAYAVTTNPAPWYSPWVSMGDHTSGSGYMLLTTPVAGTGRIWYETVSVVAGTNYILSGWAARVSLNDPNIAKLSVKVGSTSLGVFDLAALPVGTWGQFAFNYAATSSGPVVFSITDLATSDFGNDFVLDDLSLITPGLQR